jgi:hypothetical protein
LSKLATISFNNTLNYLEQTQTTLNATLNFAALVAELLTGEVTGSWEGYVTFQTQLQQAIASQTVYNPVINLNSSLDTIQTAAKTTSASANFDASLDQVQTKLLDKALAVAFNAAFDQIQTSSIDFYVLANLITSFNDLYSGEVEAALIGLVEFAMVAQQDQTKLTIANRTIDFNALMSQDGIGALLNKILGSVEFDVEFSDQRDINVDLNNFITFNTYLDKIETTNIDYVPSINFDFQALTASTNNKNTLASILLDFDNALNAAGTTGIAAFISYALQQDYITDIKLVAQGNLELTAELAESNTLQQILGTGIQFGHLMGLSAISRADFADLISFGTVTDISVSGINLGIEITLPDDRTCKIYFEDRLLITYPEE